MIIATFGHYWLDGLLICKNRKVMGTGEIISDVSHGELFIQVLKAIDKEFE